MDPKPELAAALELLWRRFLPQMLERIALLEVAAAASSAGTLHAAQIKDAHAAAHKLAGSLGSFNLARGSVLAHELELLYSDREQPTMVQSARLAAIAAELRSLIEHRY